jgi:5-methylcytosine-specific restriction endonuclease McrA
MEPSDLAEYHRLVQIVGVDDQIAPLELQLVTQGRLNGLPWKQIAFTLGCSVPFVQDLYRYKGQRCPKAIIAKVKRRDGFKCCRCPVRQIKGDGNLHVHHIGDPTSHAMSNLITLCRKCHRAEHRRLDAIARLGGMARHKGQAQR